MKLFLYSPILLTLFGISCSGAGALNIPEAGSSLTSVTLNEPKNMQDAKLVGDWTLGIWADSEAIKDGDTMTKAIKDRPFKDGSVAITVKKDVDLTLEIKATFEKGGETIEVSSTKCTGERFATKITEANQKLEIKVCSETGDYVEPVPTEWTDIAIVPVLDFEKPAEDPVERRILDNPSEFAFTGVTGKMDNNPCFGHDVKVDEAKQTVRMTANRGSLRSLPFGCQVTLSVTGYKPKADANRIEVTAKREGGTLTASIDAKSSNSDASWSRSWSASGVSSSEADMLELPDSCEFTVNLRAESSGSATGQWVDFVMPKLEKCE
jgi:hypothetical protein